MAIKDAVTRFRVLQSGLDAISSNTTTAGEIFDTADYDEGISFAMACSNYTDGTYTLKIEHGDDPGLSDAADVDSSMLIYGTLPTITAATADGDALPREGVHSTKRYVRASVVSTGVTTGATIQVLIVKHGEYLPTSQDD